MRKFVVLFLLLSFGFGLSDAKAGNRKKKDYHVEHPWAQAKVAYLGDSITDAGVPIGEWFTEETVTVNANGHRRFAACLYYQLLTLPCRF